jgi:hypothetical protein
MLCLPLSALALAACGSTVSTSGFKGAEHEVAETISNLQSDATTGEEKKICGDDLAAAVVTRLGGAKACEKAIKNQLSEINNLEVTVHSIQLDTAGTSATAGVTSIREGRKKPSSLALVKEGGKWKVSGL